MLAPEQPESALAVSALRALALLLTRCPAVAPLLCRRDALRLLSTAPGRLSQAAAPAAPRHAGFSNNGAASLAAICTELLFQAGELDEGGGLAVEVTPGKIAPSKRGGIIPPHNSAQHRVLEHLSWCIDVIAAHVARQLRSVAPLAIQALFDLPAIALLLQHAAHAFDPLAEQHCGCDCGGTYRQDCEDPAAVCSSLLRCAADLAEAVLQRPEVVGGGLNDSSICASLPQLVDAAAGAANVLMAPRPRPLGGSVEGSATSITDGSGSRDSGSGSRNSSNEPCPGSEAPQADAPETDSRYGSDTVPSVSARPAEGRVSRSSRQQARVVDLTHLEATDVLIACAAAAQATEPLLAASAGTQGLGFALDLLVSSGALQMAAALVSVAAAPPRAPPAPVATGTACSAPVNPVKATASSDRRMDEHDAQLPWLDAVLLHLANSVYLVVNTTSPRSLARMAGPANAPELQSLAARMPLSLAAALSLLLSVMTALFAVALPVGAWWQQDEQYCARLRAPAFAVEWLADVLPSMDKTTVSTQACRSTVLGSACYGQIWMQFCTDVLSRSLQHYCNTDACSSVPLSNQLIC